MHVQPLDGSLTPNSLASPLENGEAEGSLFQGAPTPVTSDNISRFVPPWSNESTTASGDGYGGSGSLQGLFGPLMGVLQQLMQMLQSLMGYGCSTPYGSGNCPPYGNGSCPPNGSGGCPPYGNERYFQNANGSSDGDPHLSFNGAKWTNMASQPDLLNSNSFAGGFRISTQVTPPNSGGVTWNQSATVSLNDGATKISLNNNGDASITSYGQSLSIAKGQTVQVGDGESVTYEQNGSLQIAAQNGYGGRIDTTLTAQEKGVNVDVTAHDVDLGGALVNGYEQQQPNPAPTPGPILGPAPNPGPEPFQPMPEPYQPMPQPFQPIPQPFQPMPQPFQPMPEPYQPYPEPIGDGPQPIY